jgi:hypothetical protein
LNVKTGIGFLFLTSVTLANAGGGFITVEQFLEECRVEREPCIAFVMGVVEGARHQTREHLKAQPYAFLVHGEPVCLPVKWGSQTLTDRVIDILENEPQVHQYSAVSGVLYALAGDSTCYST